MPVYVDKYRAQHGRMRMSHMIADTPVELHDMAKRIGVARRWFQSDASFPHYDVCEAKRLKAIALGAIEVDRHGFVAAMRRIRDSTAYEPAFGMSDGEAREADRVRAESRATEQELARLQRLFDDAGQGEHNVLALVDHYQDAASVAQAKLAAVIDLLVQNGCDCDCQCDTDGHTDGCDLCLACRIAAVVHKPG